MKNKIFLQFKKDEIAFLYALIQGNINSIDKKVNLTKEEEFVKTNLHNLENKLNAYKKLV